MMSETDVAAIAEEMSGLPDWMDGPSPVIKQIGVQKILVKLQSLLKVSGAGFFFAFENEFQI